MPTRNVVLTDRQHQIVETLIGSGRYQNASEVLRDGLRLVEAREAEAAARLAALKTAAETGWRDGDAGRYVEVAVDGLADYVTGLGRRVV